MKLGLILGAGAARGLAHIGVIQVLEKHGIKPDYIIGVSMGAVIGAYYALNGNLEGIEEKVKVRRREVLALADIRRPIKSLIGGKKIKEFLKKRFRNKTFDDLKIPFAALTTDLASGKGYLIKKGKLVDALMASCTVPGVLPPVKEKKKWLVDGDVALCNPVKKIKKYVDKVIYVDVMTEEKEINIKKLNIIKTLVYTFSINRKQIYGEIKKRKDTIIIKPEVDGSFNYLKFHKHEKFIFEGQKAALRKIKQIKEMINK